MFRESEPKSYGIKNLEKVWLTVRNPKKGPYRPLGKMTYS